MKATIELQRDNEVFLPHGEKAKNITRSLPNKAIIVATFRRQNERTDKQRKSLFLWFKQIADELNKQNYGFVDILGIKQKADTKSVKESLYMPILKEEFGLTSTTQMSRRDIDPMIDFVILKLIDRGIYIEVPEFPNKELWLDKKKETK